MWLAKALQDSDSDMFHEDIGSFSIVLCQSIFKTIARAPREEAKSLKYLTNLCISHVLIVSSAVEYSFILCKYMLLWWFNKEADWPIARHKARWENQTRRILGKRMKRSLRSLKGTRREARTCHTEKKYCRVAECK